MGTIFSESYGTLWVRSVERVGAMDVYECEDWQGRTVFCSRPAEAAARAA